MCDSPTSTQLGRHSGLPKSAPEGWSELKSGPQDISEPSSPTSASDPKSDMPHLLTNTRRPSFSQQLMLPWTSKDALWSSNGALADGLVTPGGSLDSGSSKLPASFSFDGACEEAPPTTPIKREHASYSIHQGLMTPPETPRHEIHHIELEDGQRSVDDPFTWPATPGSMRDSFDYTFKAGNETHGSPASRTKASQRVRFASPARSEASDSGSFHSCSASNEIDDDDDDNASTISTLEEYGIERPSTTETSPEPEPEPEPVEEPAPPKTEFEALTAFLPKDRIPKPARLACAQCLRLGLPCNRVMPECSRCLRRRAQQEAHTLTSSTSALSPADMCCVPMLRAHDYYGNARPFPIFLAHSDDMQDLPWWEDETAARRTLEARRRAAYDAIVVEDADRAGRTNWVLPRPGVDALAFKGREVVDRFNGGPVLRRDVGVDGPAHARRCWERV